jgi:hypothetical protein
MITLTETSICNSANISGGTSEQLPNYIDYTLYINVADAIDITVELSADGTNYYEIPESPLEYDGAGDDAIEIGYKAKYIKLTGSNTNSVTATVLGEVSS